jgi:PAS domain S-box-containing protein
MRAALPPSLWPYAVAALATGLALFIRWPLRPLLDASFPFLTFFPALAAAAYYGGLRAGLTATVLGALTADYFLMEPYYSLAVSNPRDVSRVVAFLLVGVVLSGFSEGLHRARRRAEAAEDQLRVTLASIADGVLVTDRAGRVTFLNEVAQALTGWPQAEAFGQPLEHVFPVLHEQTGQPVESPVARVLHEGAVVGPDNHALLRARDGTERPIDDRAAPIRGEGGAVQGVVLVFRDAAERRQTERERGRLLARLEAERAALHFLAEAGEVLGSSLDYPTTLARVANLVVPRLADWCAVYMLEDDGSVRQLAAAHTDPAKAVLVEELRRRFPPDQNTPHGIPQVLRSGQPEFIPEVTDDVVRRIAPEPEHYDLLRRLGPRSYLAVPLVARGRILGAQTFVLSESERRYVPDDLALAQELARRAALAVDNARLFHEAQEAARHKDAFLAQLGHELRNPLAPLHNALQILRLRRPGDEVVTEMAALMERQIGSLVRLVDDLLDVARITRGQIELRRQRLDLGAAVARAVETVRPTVDERGHALEVALPAEPLRLEADPVRFGQVLVNLLANAVKYTPPGGQIRVTAAREGQELVLHVRDNGIGISRENIGRIFDLFAQGERIPGNDREGLGIGLHLVRRLVELHGGRVAAASEGPGRGSDFVVRLPLPTTDAPAAPTAVAPPAPRRPLRVLIVDDNRDAAASCALLLRLHGGHDVRVAHEGPSALAAAAEFQPEVVLLDIGLPGGMDGYEVCRRLRQSPGFADVPIAAVTGYGQESDRRQAQAAGFTTHLIKPVDWSALSELLAQAGR